jgi:hypothetical protein
MAISNVKNDQPQPVQESPPAGLGADRSGPKRPLAPAAERALAEAAARAAAREAEVASKPKEVGGPSGPDPVRYGDWERKGIASDF